MRLHHANAGALVHGAVSGTTAIMAAVAVVTHDVTGYATAVANVTGVHRHRKAQLSMSTRTSRRYGPTV